MKTAYASALLWIPKSKLTKELQEKFRLRMFDEAKCQPCEFRPERPCDQCEECPNYQGEYCMWREEERKDGTYLGFALGYRKYLIRTLKENDYVIKDVRCRTPVQSNLSFTGTLRPEQESAVDRLMKKKYGLLEAPPRSGKTVMGAYIIIEAKYKTIILANQHEYLNEFYKTFVGDEETNTKPFTNAPKLIAKGKYPVGFARKLEDFEKYDVCLTTYQCFLSDKGQRLLDIVCKMFGTVIIDECHRVPADCFTKVVTRFNAVYRIGLTGTPERKDCFPKGTFVLMSDESLKPIQDVIVGDYVRSYDGGLVNRRVQLTHSTKKKKLVRVEHEHGSFLCTPDEEIWSETRQCYVPVLELTEDDILLHHIVE